MYVLPPIESGLDDKTVWKLRVAVYGLADASREWNKTTRRHLIEWGLIEVTTEPSQSSANCNGVPSHIDLIYVTFWDKQWEI